MIRRLASCPLHLVLTNTDLVFERAGKVLQYPLDQQDVSVFKKTLKALKVKFFEPCILTVSPDYCIFTTITVDPAWQNRMESPAFMLEVRAELSHEYEGLSEYFIDTKMIDITPVSLELQIILLHKNKIEICLQFIRQAHLRLIAIDVEGESLNLLDWRGHRQKRKYQKTGIRLLFLPFITCFIMSVLNHFHHQGLVKEQSSFERLKAQETKLMGDPAHSAVLLSQFIPVLQALVGESESALGVNQIKMDGSTILLAGRAPVGTPLSGHLEEIADLPQVEKQSLGSFEVEESNGLLIWQAKVSIIPIKPGFL